MTVSVFIYPQLNLLHSRYSGAVTRADLRENMDTIRRHPDFKLALKRLVDLTGVTAFDYNIGDAVALSEEVSRHYSDDTKVRCAYLAPTSLAFGMARMFETLLTDRLPLEVGVFRTEETARQFLDVFDPIPSLEHSNATGGSEMDDPLNRGPDRA